MGIAGMLIPAVSVLASLTLLPALLAVLGCGGSKDGVTAKTGNIAITVGTRRFLEEQGISLPADVMQLVKHLLKEAEVPGAVRFLDVHVEQQGGNKC